MNSKKSDKQLYQQLRGRSCEQLWNDDVPQFDKLLPSQRLQHVALVRVVGVVFSESGTEEQKQKAKDWLRGLLNDPDEKIRRYAMNALPKLRGGVKEEADLLKLLQNTTGAREKKYLGQALAKIGGVATLEVIEKQKDKALFQTQLKVKAGLLRNQAPSTIKTSAILSDFSDLRIHLHGRRGLEIFVKDEVEDYIRRHSQFRILDVQDGLVTIAPIASFSIGDIYSLRCFGNMGFVLGTIPNQPESRFVESLAKLVVSPLSQCLFKVFTQGSLRYRFDFAAGGHQRGVVRQASSRAFALCPNILNDAYHAPWTIEIFSSGNFSCIELMPKLAPDPRFSYRQKDVPAASHPPLAASLARLGGCKNEDIVWDPFCGSGLELIERGLLGGSPVIFGSDLSAEAIEITKKNFAAANIKGIPPQFTCCDFRDFPKIQGLGANSVSLIITNPPLGKRVPIPNLQGLINDLFRIAGNVLKPGGRLVLSNPFRNMRCPVSSLKMKLHTPVDYVGFDCYIEKYVKER